jgi:exonuclease SbcC
LQRDLALIEKKIATLEDPGFLKGCKCLNEAENALAQKPGMKEKISTLSKKHSDIDIANLQDKIDKINAICEKADAIEREVKSSIGKSNIFDERIKVAEERSSLEHIHMQKMLKHVSNDPENNRLDELKIRKRELEKASGDYDGKQISLAKSIGQLQGEIKRLREERKRFNELTSKWKLVELVSEATSKKGIPLNVLGRKLPEVNAEIAQILQGCTGFTVELEADQESNAMDIYINYGDSRRIIECASGMEKMMASLAIRVALMNLTTLPRCDLLMIDEGFGALDETNVEACSGLLQNLKKWFKSILVISHVDAVKDSVDNVIEISKKGQDSYVNTFE